MIALAVFVFVFSNVLYGKIFFRLRIIFSYYRELSSVGCFRYRI